MTAACSSTAVSAPPVPKSGPALIRNEPPRALITRSGVPTEVLGGEAGAWQVRTPCGKPATVTGGKPVTEVAVVLDPGHGGGETGAVGANGLLEEDLNLAVAKAAQRALEAEGITVLLTRTGDYPVTISVRAALATAVKPQAVVSVHHNGGANEHSHRPGTETYYQHASPAARRLAGLVYEETVAFFSRHHGIRWRATATPGAKPQLNHNGEDYFGILRRTAGVPTVLSEGLFLSASAAEARLLARADVQRGEGEAIARAIVRFLRSDAPGSGFVASRPRGPEGRPANPPCVDPPLG
ncbi:MAG: N-acetylmuramoyl-L-alanine amidase [Actinomycetota bacterium]